MDPFEEFYYLFLEPCVHAPRKYLEYKTEIEEEWKEVKKSIYDAQDYKWIHVCIHALRLVRI